jgi:hypothetical protein
MLHVMMDSTRIRMTGTPLGLVAVFEATAMETTAMETTADMAREQIKRKNLVIPYSMKGK